MTTSLLSLPDELLGLVVDQAAGEYAPRLYKQRQDTCRALSLVNKRVGAIAQAKLLEAVRVLAGRAPQLPGIQIDRVREPGRARQLHAQGLGRNVQCALDFTWFAAVRDLRLDNMCAVRLDDVAQLRELRVLVLSECELVASRPFVAVKLERLVLYFCDNCDMELTFEPFTAAGCPALAHLYVGLWRPGTGSGLGAHHLVKHAANVGLEICNLNGSTAAWTTILPPEPSHKTALLDKALFDLMLDEVNQLVEPLPDVRHLRMHSTAVSSRDRLASIRYGLIKLAAKLATVFPSLETLYVPIALETSCVMLSRQTVAAVEELVAACGRRRVVVVFEHSLDSAGACEDRASPHFEARCRRVKAERATAAASRTTSGARAAATRR